MPEVLMNQAVYFSNNSKEELADAKARGILSRNVYALGGVTFDNLKEVEQLGFYGAALLGGFWETYSNSPA